eukprot:g1781.t1
MYVASVPWYVESPKKGDAVILHGLQNRTDLNEKSGVVFRECSSTSERVVVRVEKKYLQIKPINLAVERHYVGSTEGKRYINRVKNKYSRFKRVVQPHYIKVALNGLPFIPHPLMQKFEKADLDGDNSTLNELWKTHHDILSLHMLLTFGEFPWKHFRAWLIQYLSLHKLRGYRSERLLVSIPKEQRCAYELQCVVVGKSNFEDAVRKGERNEGDWGIRRDGKETKEDIESGQYVARLKKAWEERGHIKPSSSTTGRPQELCDEIGQEEQSIRAAVANATFPSLPAFTKLVTEALANVDLNDLFLFQKYNTFVFRCVAELFYHTMSGSETQRTSFFKQVGRKIIERAGGQSEPHNGKKSVDFNLMQVVYICLRTVVQKLAKDEPNRMNAYAFSFSYKFIEFAWDGVGGWRC